MIQDHHLIQKVIFSQTYATQACISLYFLFDFKGPYHYGTPDVRGFTHFARRLFNFKSDVTRLLKPMRANQSVQLKLSLQITCFHFLWLSDSPSLTFRRVGSFSPYQSSGNGCQNYENTIPVVVKLNDVLMPPTHLQMHGSILSPHTVSYGDTEL